MAGMATIFLPDAPSYGKAAGGRLTPGRQTAIAGASKAAQGVADAIGTLATAKRQAAAQAVIRALLPIMESLASETTKGYPEYNPDQARDDHGRWSSAGYLYHGTPHDKIESIRRGGLT